MRKIKILKLSIFTAAVFGLGFFAFFSKAQAATTYYVSPSGSDSYSGTSLQPFKTIQKCADTVVAGDTCIVKNGTYTASNACKSDMSMKCVVTTDKDGTAGRLGNDVYGFNKYDPSTWITFKAENHLGAIVSGNNNSVGLCFDLVGANYIRVEGFDIKQCGSAGFGLYKPSANISIYNNTIHDMGRRCTDNIYGQGLGLFANAGVQYITIDRNIIHTNGRYATGENGCTNGNINWQNHDQGIYVSTVNHIAITNNIFNSNKSGWAVDLDRGTDHAYVINNTFYGANPNRDGYIVIWPNDSDYTWKDLVADGMIIQNNIFHNPRNSAIDTGLQHPWPTAASIINSNISNNIIYGASHILSVYDTPWPFYYLDNTNDINNWNSGVGGANSGNVISGNIIGKDPLFVNAPTDFHLASNLSPAINAGLAANAPAVDITGQARVGGPDIGAYEYVSSVNEKIIYVDNTSQNCTDGATTYNPTTKSCGSGAYKMFTTIQSAADIVNPGDTVIVKDGTYTDTDSDGYVVKMTRSGSEGSMITFKSENKWGAVISGGTYGIWLNPSISYIRIEDFQITKRAGENTYAGIYAQHNCLVQYNCGTRPQTHDIQIIRNYIHDLGNFITSQNNAISGVYVGPTTYNWLIDRNLIHDIYKSPSSTEPDGSPYRMSRDHALYISGYTAYGGRSNSVTVTNNIMYRIGGAVVSIHCSNCTIANNTMAYTIGNAYGTLHALSFDGIDCGSNQGSACTGPAENVLIENNIIYNPLSTVPIFWVSGSRWINVIIRNNIIFHPTKALLEPTQVPNLGSITFSNNYCNGTTGCQYSSTDPLFTNASTYDFTLLSNSPAIDRGLSTNAPAYDFLGNTRPVDGNGIGGAQYDIGAYEYTGSVASSPDVDGSGSVNIKDIQACIKVITGTDTRYQNQCRVLAAPDTATNIKDIQEIIKAIIAP